jgi:hypothetical protein
MRRGRLPSFRFGQNWGVAVPLGPIASFVSAAHDGFPKKHFAKAPKAEHVASGSLRRGKA